MGRFIDIDARAPRPTRLVESLGESHQAFGNRLVRGPFGHTFPDSDRIGVKALAYHASTLLSQAPEQVFSAADPQSRTALDSPAPRRQAETRKDLHIPQEFRAKLPDHSDAVLAASNRPSDAFQARLTTNSLAACENAAQRHPGPI